jgi:hypothetical protein
VSEWQPIETAPKDGTPVLCFWRNQYGGKDGWAVAEFGEPTDKWAEACWHEQGNTENRFGEPDFWMPLPEPPK